MSVKIGTTSRSGLSVEQVGGNDVYKMLSQIQSVLDGLGSEFATLFAEPVDAGRDIDWYAPDGAKMESAADLVKSGRAEELNAGLVKLDKLASGIKAYAADLRTSKSAASRNYADILEKALTQPRAMQEQYTYFVDGQPVLIGWGFSDGNNDLVEGIRDLIKKTSDEIKDKMDSASGAAPHDHDSAEAVDKTNEQDSPEAGNDTDNSAEQKPDEAPLRQNNQSQTESPSPQIQPATMQIPKPSGNLSWLPAALVGAGLLAAGAVAAWYFLGKSPEKEAENSTPDQSLAFLKGSLTANHVLVNESGEDVELRITFKGTDGIGEVTIREKNQTCTGAVKASLQPENKVLFDISGVKCPNNNNYEALTLLCGRNEKTCLATNRNGDTWKLDLK